MAAITLEQVRKAFAGSVRPAVADLSLSVADGERLAVVGPSGSGKSTVLRIIAGLDAPTSGHVRIDGADVTQVPPESRDLAMVFQSYALYPHMTVRANLGFGLRMRGMNRADIETRVSATAASLGLDPLLDRKPADLSGGERQRVALGRAIVRQPRAFLFDEPLSNLDPRLRGDTRAELVALHQRLGATMVYVTHDQEEAMTLGQRIAVLHEGRLEQVASPETLYRRPANRFVARFIGSPPMNVIDGPAAAVAAPEAVRDRVRREALAVGVRPHDVRLVGAAGAPLAGEVAVVEPLGHMSIVHVTTPEGARVVATVPPGTPARPGDVVGLAFPAEGMTLFAPDGRQVELSHTTEGEAPAWNRF
jgi:multiple sugar transport system ATP-binding protein